MIDKQNLITNNIITIDSNECWLMKPTTYNGYARVKYAGKLHRAHRFSYEAFVGPIPDGLLVLHHCDVRNCANPNHLFIGTHKQNMQDMVNKGRDLKGTMTHCRKGHEYTTENTYIQPSTGWRECRQCNNAGNRKRRQKKSGLDKSIQK
jgi:hypothetical protein